MTATIMTVVTVTATCDGCHETETVQGRADESVESIVARLIRCGWTERFGVLLCPSCWHGHLAALRAERENASAEA